MGMLFKIDPDFQKKLGEECVNNNYIDPKDFDRFNVKRGLRNADGTGVMAGVTNICNVHGYVINEGEKQPIEGELIYRGYNIKDLIENADKEDRFGYEEIVYLLLIGSLPTKEDLESFNKVIFDNRELPESFFEDMILKAPSPNIMNKLSRSVLALYSYVDFPEMRTAEYELATALSIIAKFPIIMVDAYQVKRRTYEGKTMFMHPLRQGESTAECILSMLRADREYTHDEAKMLDLLLMLHAEHGGGNNSTFACRVLTSSGTDPYSAYAAAIGSLKGPKHGGANAKVMEMLHCVEENVKNWDDDNEVSEFLRKIVNKEANDKTGLIYGMGHAVYTLSDPRAVILKKNAIKLAKGTEFEKEFKLLDSIERLSIPILTEVHGADKSYCANVDLYSGLVYKMLKIPQDLVTPLFAVARMAGWAAHRYEELVTGNRIIRPAYKALQKAKKYVKIEDR